MSLTAKRTERRKTHIQTYLRSTRKLNSLGFGARDERIDTYIHRVTTLIFFALFVGND